MQFLTLDKIITTGINTDFGGNQDTGWFVIGFLPTIELSCKNRVYWSPAEGKKISTWTLLAPDGIPTLLEIIAYPISLLALADLDYGPSGMIKSGYPSFALDNDAIEGAKGLSPYYIDNINGFRMTVYRNGIRISYLEREPVLFLKPRETVVFEFDQGNIFIGLFLYLSKEELMSIPKVAAKIRHADQKDFLR